MRTIGFLSTRSRDESKELTAAFLAGLKTEGFAEVNNVAIKYRWAEFVYDRLPSLGSELIGERVSVIAAVGGIHSGLAAKQVTSEIPIVFVSAGDPVALNLVSSLNRQHENVTGISMITVALAPKRLELLNEVVPAPARVAFLANPRSPYFQQERDDVVAAATKLRRALSVSLLQVPRKSRHRLIRFPVEALEPCLSAEIRFSTASVIAWFRSPLAILYPQSINGGSSRRSEG
jgi:putative ABC transport system substrate-binding protein